MVVGGVVATGVASDARLAGLLKSMLRSVPLNEWRLLGLATLLPSRDWSGAKKAEACQPQDQHIDCSDIEGAKKR